MTKLIEEDNLYVFEKILCLEQLKKRVFDKTPTARKYAITFFSETVRKNPVLIKVSPAFYYFTFIKADSL